MSMFCYQCEQTAQGNGCTSYGVCGKDPETAAMQDLLVHLTKGVAMYGRRAGELGARDNEADRFVCDAMFTTLTNTNFDPEYLQDYVRRGTELRERLKGRYEDACREADRAPEELDGTAALEPADDLNDMISQGEQLSIENRIDRHGEDVAGLQEAIVYGVKGAAAYAHHAAILGEEDDETYALFHELLDYVASEPTDMGDLLAHALQTGELNLQAMELLDRANTGTYGDPEPTQVRVTPLKGKCIVVSGHDLKDLKALLEQTEGTGINVYTHGEMLPAHGYPELKKHEHLVGNYGSAWQNQRSEFEDFPGAVLMTTNCLMKPKDTYKERIFTSGPTGWPGVTHISDTDFSQVIQAAQAAEGFAEDDEEKTITVGFGHEAVMGVAGAVIDAVKNGDIRHFFLIGGCDGAKPGRNYYTRFAESVPDDCLILTLACGKYRFNKLEFGDIGGIPRLLDIGQCNDSYSAIQIALALADAFDCEVNELPLSFILSWYEQKAVAILLTLFSLGIEDMKLGPSLPAFITDPVLKVLVDKFHIQPISTVEQDLEEALA